MLIKEDIFLDIAVTNKKDLFERMSKIFLIEGYVTTNYLSSLLEREKKYPTALNFGSYNVAIPHTESDFINKERIVFVRTKNPIIFNDMVTNEERKVELVIFLLVKNKVKQTDYLMKLMNLLSDEDKYNILLKSNNINQIQNIFI